MRQHTRTRTTRRPARLAAILAASAGLLATACGNVYEVTENKNPGQGAPTANGSAGTGGGSVAKTDATATGDLDFAKLTQKNPSKEPGVSDSSIKVAGVAATTNILKLPVDQAFNGVQAYFDMVNTKYGGIWGRKLEITDKRDDQMVNNKAEAQALATQDIFAIAPVATVLFLGSDVLGDSGIPTFGWNISPEWAGPKNLFGEKSSYICVTCGYPTQSFIAKQFGFSKVGVLAYNQAQSAECVNGVRAGFEKYKVATVDFVDDAIPFGNADYGVQVQKMRDAGVQMVITCMDTSATITLAKEIAKQKAGIIQYIQMGYDYDLVKNFSAEFEGSMVMTQFSPIEFEPQPPGLKDYLQWIDKVPGAKRGELSIAGWLNADLLYRGLALAGPDFTRQKVIDAINNMTNWSAGSMNAGFDWTIGHDQESNNTCQAFSKIHDGKFEPVFTEPGKPFVCFDTVSSDLLEPPRRASMLG